jgi:hypothetical protein
VCFVAEKCEISPFFILIEVSTPSNVKVDGEVFTGVRCEYLRDI